MENSYRNYFETIYSFHDDSHGMDAFIKNKCDAEMLAIIEEISKELGINKQIRLETLPAREGSYDEWLQTIFYANIMVSFINFAVQNTITRTIWNIKRLALKVFGL